MTSAAIRTTGFHRAPVERQEFSYGPSPTVAALSTGFTSIRIWEDVRVIRSSSPSRHAWAIKGVNLFGGGETAPTVGETKDIAQDQFWQDQFRPDNSDRDSLLSSLRDLQKLYAGAEGEIVERPRVEAIDDAIVVVQAWPDEIPIPVLDFDDEGQIALDIIGEHGLARAGIDFLGRENAAVYSMIEGTTVIDCGSMNTTSTTEVLRFLRKLALRLA